MNEFARINIDAEIVEHCNLYAESKRLHGYVNESVDQTIEIRELMG